MVCGEGGANTLMKPAAWNRSWSRYERNTALCKREREGDIAMMNTQEAGTLLLRLVLGFTFLVYGVDKYRNGLADFAAGFPDMGLPSFAGYLIASIELVGGAALLLGIATRLFAGLLACVMVGAIVFVKLPEGFIGGYEFNIVLLAMAIYLVLNGSRWLSLDAGLWPVTSRSSQSVYHSKSLNKRTS